MICQYCNTTMEGLLFDWYRCPKCNTVERKKQMDIAKNTAYVLYGANDDDNTILYAIFSSRKDLNDYVTKFNLDLDYGYWQYQKLPANPTDREGL